ncbi:MAG TPA: heavy metal translocating P-type ATPase [Anaerolineaceae bacterium]|nr:heavy metal translocating P-type ATPase [Anaerolineaceae bacterium]HPN53913.1 heavy metal translocating P-type ATPase [Anaerolineaceae bacterium]
MISFIKGFWRFLLASNETRLALVGGVLLLISGLFSGWPGLALQLAALAVAGWPVARSGLTTLFKERRFSINLLMTVAAVGAVIIGETPEGASLVVLFAVAEALEGFTAERAHGVISGLVEMIPARALRLGAGGEEWVGVEQLEIGDKLLIRPGERIPMDGVIEQGGSEINQAPITGESMPVYKTTGAEVFAGTLNGSGALHIQVSRLVQDNTLTRIVHMVEEAQNRRAPIQRFIDRFAEVYTPAIIVLAALVAVIPPLFFGQPFLNPVEGHGWLYRALSLLVIGCPCALVISTPVTMLSAISAAARQGVLVKGGVHLESLQAIRLFAFDKTGTLTRGQPAVTAFGGADCGQCQDCDDCYDVLALACSVERQSTHPLARAVVSAAENRGLDGRYAPAEAVTVMAGMGLQGAVNGKTVTVGSHRLFEADHPHQKAVCRQVEAAEQNGQTAMLLCDGDGVRGMIAVADELRPDSQDAVRELREAGCQTAILTGDNEAVAQAVGARLGIDEIHAGLLPQDKVSAVEALKARHGAVAMVGDGINDTPALAAASLGIALGGSSSAQAMETADIVLMGDNLHLLPFTLRLSRFTHRLLRENIAISLGVKFLFLGLALLGVTSMWMAVVADMGVSLAVTTNGLRALRVKA